MELSKTKFKTPAVTLIKSHLANPDPRTTKFKNPTKSVRVFMDPNNPEHAEFLNALQNMEREQQTSESLKDFESIIKPRTVKKYNDGQPDTFELHPTHKTLELKQKANQDIAVLDLTDVGYVESLELDISYGSEVVLEGEVVAWPEGEGTLEIFKNGKEPGEKIKQNRRGIALKIEKVRVLRRGKAEQEATLNK